MLAYDDVGRVTDIDHTLFDSTLLAHDWTYDQANRVDDNLNSVDGVLGYDYDASGQLTDVSGELNDTYAYDNNGNRIGVNHATNMPNLLIAVTSPCTPGSSPKFQP